jgi:hypothetical protein
VLDEAAVAEVGMMDPAEEDDAPAEPARRKRWSGSAGSSATHPPRTSAVQAELSRYVE